MIRVLLVALTAASARPVDESGRLCRVGNLSLPAEIFESYAGWECYEDTYRDARGLSVHVCLERHRGEDYSVPCFKSGSRMMSFNLKNEESVRDILGRYDSPQLNDELIRCYLSVVRACETSPDGWLRYDSALSGRLGSKSFLTNMTDVCALEGQSKFHITMLSISMIIGIPVALIFCYCSWVTQNVALYHCRNLIAALLLRTFFTILIESEVVGRIIETPDEPLVSTSGCEALAAFETLTSNLVMAFWLILTFYLLECSKNRFEREPSVRTGAYIVLGLAVAMAVIWMIIMGAGDYGNCWLERTPVQWVNDALRLGYLLVQLGLISIVAFRVLTDLAEVENSQAPLLRKMSILTACLTPLFVLQFSMTASHPNPTEENGGDPRIYTEYFFDGFQGALVSLLYLFLPEVTKFMLDVLGLESRKRCHRVFDTGMHTDHEVHIPHHRAHSPVPTTSVTTEDDLRKDVTYTSVLTPERFEKTIKLYNRLNVLPKTHPPVQESPVRSDPDNSSIKSEYYDVDDDSVRTVYDDVSNSPTETRAEVAELAVKASQPGKYYTSRYLLEDSDSSATEESVIEVKPQAELPPECDKGKTIGEWLESCRCEFEEYAERAVRKRRQTAEGYALHRSLSGGILTEREISGSVRVNLKPAEADRLRKGSAPALTTTESIPEVTQSAPVTPADDLPSVYDDLKRYPRVSRPRLNRYNRKREYNAGWSNYRDRLLENKRRNRSLGALEEPQVREQLSGQLNALLSPRYEPAEFHTGELHRNPFVRVIAEDLSAVECGGESGVGDVATVDRKGVVDDWEPQRMHFVGDRRD